MPTTPIYALPYPAATDPADVPHDLQLLATRLDGLGFTAPPVFTALPFAANWGNFNVAGGYQAAGYTKNAATGVVTLRGTIHPTTSDVADNVNTVVGNLPSGFRPLKLEQFPSAAFNGVNGIFICRLDVQADGSVHVRTPVGAALPVASAFLSLSGVSFATT